MKFITIYKFEMKSMMKFAILFCSGFILGGCGGSTPSDKAEQNNKLSEQTDKGLKEKEVADNSIKSVKIDKLLWTAENLNVTTFRNGETIPESKTAEEWKIAAKEKKACYSSYANKEENGISFGKLYNWYAVNDKRGLAPKGWHIPSDEELTGLISISGGKDVAGGKLKEAGTLHWITPNNGADNSSNFTALPGGYRGADGTFNNITKAAGFWSVKEFDAQNAWRISLQNETSSVDHSIRDKAFGFSVRCVKD